MGSSLLFLRSAEVGEQSWGGSGHTYTRSQGHAMRYEGGGGGADKPGVRAVCASDSSPHRAGRVKPVPWVERVWFGGLCR